MVREFVLLSVMALYFYFVSLRLLLAEIYSLLKSTHNTHVICRWVLPVGSLFLLDTWEFGTKGTPYNTGSKWQISQEKNIIMTYDLSLRHISIVSHTVALTMS